jgi:hypothetical protein
VDHGSLAPARVLEQVFAARGVPISNAQVRRDMGLLKRDHIDRILRSPAVWEQWTQRIGRTPTCADLDELFAELVPLQMQCLSQSLAVDFTFFDMNTGNLDLNPHRQWYRSSKFNFGPRLHLPERRPDGRQNQWRHRSL